jgi:hypothetical protein
MKTKLDWSALGQFFSTVLNLFSFVRTAFENMQIGMPIVPWLLGDEGRVAFAACLGELGSQYRKAVRSEVVNVHTLRVYLDAPVVMPFPDWSIEYMKGEGTALVTSCNGELYIDGRRVILKQLEDFAGPHRKISGSEFLERLEKVDGVHPSVLDALLDHRHMLPNKWFGSNYGRISFPAVVFRAPEYNNPGMAKFFGVETHISPSSMFLRALSISGLISLSGQVHRSRIIEATIETMQGYAPNSLYAVLE